MYNFCIYGGILRRRQTDGQTDCEGGTPPSMGEIPSLGRVIFNIGIFRKKGSKYAKLLTEPYMCENLNGIYRFFSILTFFFLLSSI